MELARLERIVTSGLATTAADWPAIRQADAWIHRAAHLLRNPEERDVLDLRREYRRLLAEMRRGQAALGTLAPTVTHVRKVTRS